jgi:hypothetical protein
VARILLVLPSSTYRASEFLAAAARLGVEVVVASEEHQSLAPVMGERFLEIPLAEPERAAALICAHAEQLALDAVIAVDDAGALVASLAAAALGLRSNTVASVAATLDKSLMRERLLARA